MRKIAIIKGKQSNNTSGYPGIYYSKKEERWIVRIKVNGKNKHLGGYPTLEDAIEARKYYEKQYFDGYSHNC